ALPISGSTLLVSLLNSSPEIFCDNEIYHRRVANPWRYLNFRAKLGNRPVYGFKLLTYHMGKVLNVPREKQSNFLQRLHEEGYKIIYLRREDLFRQALSNVYVRKRDQFHNTSDKDNKKMIRVEVSELSEWVDGLRSQANFEAELLDGIPHLALGYERHLMDAEAHTDTLQNLSEYLNVAVSQPKTKLKPVTPRSLESFIENHEEIEAYRRSLEPVRQSRK
ncbi:MAG: hypothetical protein AAF206_07450, partial [Bacteroidota bacterium]